MATLPRPRFAAPVVWRPLADDDLAYVAALEAQIHAAPWTLGNFRDALSAGYLAQAGEREGRIVAYGVLMLAPGEAQVLNLSVVPDARREGLGRALLERFMRDAAQRGAEQIFLEVRVGNVAGDRALRQRRLRRRRPARRVLPRGRHRRARGRAGAAPRAGAGRRRRVMATRDELLVELGLAPIWRRRPGAEFPGAGELPPAPPRPPPGRAPPSADREADRGSTPATVSRRGSRAPEAGAAPDSDARRLRIAALDWDGFAADVDACTACGLARTRRCSVPGVGDRAAEWLFVGEAPGAEEDERGEPFVGQAGKLLDAMLAALSLARGRNVYIANVLKCRPPGNRTPEPSEVEACRPYLDRQIELIRPKLIVALGRSAANTCWPTTRPSPACAAASTATATSR